MGNVATTPSVSTSITDTTLITFDLTSIPSLPIALSLNGTTTSIGVIIGTNGNYQTLTFINGANNTSLTLPNSIPVGTGPWQNFLTIFIATNTISSPLFTCKPGIYITAGPMTISTATSTWSNVVGINIPVATYTAVFDLPITYYSLTIPEAQCLGLITSDGTNPTPCNTLIPTICSTYTSLPYCSQLPNTSTTSNPSSNTSTTSPSNNTSTTSNPSSNTSITSSPPDNSSNNTSTSSGPSSNTSITSSPPNNSSGNTSNSSSSIPSNSSNTSSVSVSSFNLTTEILIFIAILIIILMVIYVLYQRYKIKD